MDYLNNLFKFENESIVCGLSSELTILYYLKYFESHDDNVLIVTNSLYDANKIFRALKTYTEDVCLFPMDDFLASVAIAISPDLKVTRLETLEHIKKNKKTIVVTNLMGYLRYLPNMNQENIFNVEIIKNKEIDDFYLLCYLILICKKPIPLGRSSSLDVCYSMFFLSPI